MKPLLILVGVFLLSSLLLRILFGTFDYLLSGKIALSAMLIFTAVGHFIYSKGMCMMLPPYVPFRMKIVYWTGVLEFLAAAGIFFPDFRIPIGVFLIVFFILILPANIYAAWKNIDYQTATAGGKGLSYLWFRIPFQIVLIIWKYFFVIK